MRSVRIGEPGTYLYNCNHKTNHIDVQKIADRYDTIGPEHYGKTNYMYVPWAWFYFDGTTNEDVRVVPAALANPGSIAAHLQPLSIGEFFIGNQPPVIKQCVHEWKHYQGIMDSYDYCTKCDTKSHA